MCVCAAAGEGRSGTEIERRCARVGESGEGEDGCERSGVYRRLGGGDAEGLEGGRVDGRRALRLCGRGVAHALRLQKVGGGSGEVVLRLGCTPRSGHRKAAAG